MAKSLFKQRLVVVWLLALLLVAGLLPPQRVLAQASVTIDPASGLPASTVRAIGTGFTPGHRMEVKWEDGQFIESGGLPVQFVINSTGTFDIYFLIPFTAAPGSRLVNFNDVTGGASLSVSFVVLSPDSVWHGTSSLGQNVDLVVKDSYVTTIRFSGDSGLKICNAAAPIVNDQFSCTAAGGAAIITGQFISDTQVSGTYSYAGQNATWTATKIFSSTAPPTPIPPTPLPPPVIPPNPVPVPSSCPPPAPSYGMSVSLDPCSGPVGTTVTATGQGFNAEWGIKVKWAETKLIAETNTDEKGKFKVSFRVPEADPKDYTIIFEQTPPQCQGQCAGTFAAPRFRVTPPSGSNPPPIPPPPAPPAPTQGVISVGLSSEVKASPSKVSDDKALRITVASNGNPLPDVSILRRDGDSTTPLGFTDKNGILDVIYDTQSLPAVNTISYSFEARSDRNVLITSKLLAYSVTIENSASDITLDNNGSLVVNYFIGSNSILPDTEDLLTNGAADACDCLPNWLDAIMLFSKPAEAFSKYKAQKGDVIKQQIYLYAPKDANVPIVYRYILKIERASKLISSASLWSTNPTVLYRLTQLRGAIIGVLHSPANLHLTDPTGRQAGFDAATGRIVNEIPGSYYSGPGTEPQVLMVVGAIPGDYQFTAIGTGTGTIHLEIGGINETGGGTLQSSSTAITPSQVITAQVNPHEPVATGNPATPPLSMPPTSDGSFADTGFLTIWERTDLPITHSALGPQARSWTWGPQPITNGTREAYAEGSGGTRLVQYFDKSRMEINDPNAPRNQWYVTNGLLPIELMTGRQQNGLNLFDQRDPAKVTAIGDPDQFPTYADLLPFYQSPGTVNPDDLGKSATGFINKDGTITGFNDYVNDPETILVHGENNHGVAKAFIDFMNQQGQVFQNGRYVRSKVYDPLFVFGLPVTGAYWVKVKVGGVERPILFQVFERRVLTYNPSNPPAFRVEMGNVGQHYLGWRYGH
jgi:hypothetical protein